jgi:hypothetical protein
MRWSEEDDARVNDENDHLGFTIGGFLLDPFFWQANSKARGWLKYLSTGYFDQDEHDIEDFS